MIPGIPILPRPLPRLHPRPHPRLWRTHPIHLCQQSLSKIRFYIGYLEAFFKILHRFSGIIFGANQLWDLRSRLIRWKAQLAPWPRTTLWRLRRPPPRITWIWPPIFRLCRQSPTQTINLCLSGWSRQATVIQILRTISHPTRLW